MHFSNEKFFKKRNDFSLGHKTYPLTFPGKMQLEVRCQFLNDMDTLKSEIWKGFVHTGEPGPRLFPPLLLLSGLCVPPLPED